MHEEWLPEDDDLDAQVARIVEECGEVLVTVGKLQRFGPASRYHTHGIDPKTGKYKTCTCRVLDEMEDLIHALEAARPGLMKLAARAEEENHGLVAAANESPEGSGEVAKGSER